MAAGDTSLSGARRVATLLLVAALAAVGGAAFHRVFTWPSLVPVVTVAVTLPVALSWLMAAGDQPRPLSISLAITVVGWFLSVSETLFRADTMYGFLPTAGMLRAVLVDLVDAWKATLTTILPAPPDPGLLVLVSALAWTAAFSGAEIALRTRSVAAPAVPAIVVFVIALLLGVDGPGSNVVTAVAIVALIGLLVLVRSRAGVLSRGLAAGLPSIAALALVAAAAGPELPLVADRQPFDPRQHISTPPPSLRESINPLDQVSEWLLSPKDQLFTIHASAPENWRLAVLDRFDGLTWSSSSRFVATGTRVPGPADPAGQRDTVFQTVTIQSLSGVWVPAADRPASIDGIAAAVDPAAGVLIGLEPLHEGERYDVVSRVPRYTLAELKNATPANDQEAMTSLKVPGRIGTDQAGPQLGELERTAREAVAGSTFPFQEALLLADYLRTHLVNDTAAPPGHGYRNLAFFLSSGRGTSEQFASAFGVMARTLGLPSRIAVGFKPGHSEGGTWQVLSGDVLVWPEIDFKNLGWVPFYPTPDQTLGATGSRSVPAGESSIRQDIDRQIASAPPSSPPAVRPPLQPPGPRPSPAPGAVWPVVTGTAVGTIGSVYILLAAIGPLWRRRRRRRSRTAIGRVLGAWDETLDRLREVGVRRSASMTAMEVANLGAAAIGGAAKRPLTRLAGAVNQVGFDTLPPDDASADVAWQDCDALDRLMAASQSRVQAIGRRLHPRTLATLVR